MLLLLRIFDIRASPLPAKIRRACHRWMIADL
jgi:hypothetical protein